MGGDGVEIQTIGEAIDIEGPGFNLRSNRTEVGRDRNENQRINRAVVACIGKCAKESTNLTIGIGIAADVQIHPLFAHPKDQSAKCLSDGSTALIDEIICVALAI